MDGIVTNQDLQFRYLMERYNIFRVIMVVRHDQNGKKYLYDIMNIKKETSSFFGSEDLTQ